MAIKTHSGQLNKKIQVLQPAEAFNDEGGRVKIFSSLMYTWANVRPVSNYRVTDPVALLDTKEITIRWAQNRTAIDVNYLLVYNGKAYTINGIEDVEEKERFIRFTGKCKGFVADYLPTQVTAQRIDFEPAQGDTMRTFPELIGKELLFVSRSGIGQEIITDGLPAQNQVLFIATSGAVVFGSALSANEWVTILYNG